MEILSFSERIVKMHEAHLLRLIKQRMPKPFRDRFNFLVSKRDDHTLTDSEHEELLLLIDKLEDRQTEYLSQLIELAKLNDISLPEVMKKYHIRPRKNL